MSHKKNHQVLFLQSKVEFVIRRRFKSYKQCWALSALQSLNAVVKPLDDGTSKGISGRYCNLI